MRTSDEINEIAAALAKAQGEIEDASKDSKNPHFNSKYADLASVRAAIRGPASKHGLAYTQFIRATDTHIIVETMLLHSSGQYMSEVLPLPVVPDKTGRIGPQVFGSAMTYARRYALMGIFGIAPSEEDDGEAAMRPGGGTITDKQAEHITALALEVKADVPKLLAFFKTESISDMRAGDFPKVVAMLEAKRPKEAA